MKIRAVSRRRILEAGACALAAAAVPQNANAHKSTAQVSKADETARKYYAAWGKEDWHPIDVLLAEDFTFTSAAGDDHINKSAFKTQCWQTQNKFIERFDLEHVFGTDDEAIVLYVCWTKNGKSFRNVEFLRLKGDALLSIECFFGAQSSFPSAVSKS
jgi:ketosteroid isomerase-like protein